MEHVTCLLNQLNRPNRMNLPDVCVSTAQAVTISSMATLSKKMLPIKLNFFKRMFYAMSVTGLKPALSGLPAPVVRPAVQSAEVPIISATSSAGPLQFTSSTIDQVLQDIETEAARAPQLPSWPKAPEQKKDLQQRRRDRKLLPGQWDPDASPFSKREKELVDRKSYLKNFWYAAGKLASS